MEGSMTRRGFFRSLCLLPMCLFAPRLVIAKDKLKRSPMKWEHTVWRNGDSLDKTLPVYPSVQWAEYIIQKWKSGIDISSWELLEALEIRNQPWKSLLQNKPHLTLQFMNYCWHKLRPKTIFLSPNRHSEFIDLVMWWDDDKRETHLNGTPILESAFLDDDHVVFDTQLPGFQATHYVGIQYEIDKVKIGL